MRSGTADLLQPFELRTADDASMFDDCYPWDVRLDNAIRSTRVVDPARFGYPLERSNETLLIELGTVYGQEGDDFQNPYAWTARGVLDYPQPLVPAPGGLQPNFGVDGAMTPNEVQLNVLASSHILEV